MFHIILAIHIVLCILLVGLVLLQQGKGADAGALMGGGTNSVLGAGATGDFISKLTTGLAIGFMVTSIFLVKYYNSRSPAVRGAGGFDPLQGSVLEGAIKEAEANALTAVAKETKEDSVSTTSTTDEKVDTTEASEAVATGTEAESAPKFVDKVEEATTEVTEKTVVAENPLEEAPIVETIPMEEQPITETVN